MKYQPPSTEHRNGHWDCRIYTLPTLLYWSWTANHPGVVHGPCLRVTVRTRFKPRRSPVVGSTGHRGPFSPSRDGTSSVSSRTSPGPGPRSPTSLVPAHFTYRRVTSRLRPCDLSLQGWSGSYRTCRCLIRRVQFLDRCRVSGP